MSLRRDKPVALEATWLRPWGNLGPSWSHLGYADTNALKLIGDAEIKRQCRYSAAMPLRCASGMAVVLTSGTAVACIAAGPLHV